ncbi:MAG: VTT domain-containing protein [Anaerolineae bacterium]
MQSTHRWILLVAFTMAVILVPFLLFGAHIEAWTDDFVESASDQPAWVAMVLGSLLASDILIPTPSSLVSTAAGLILGFVQGTLVSWTAMTISCIIGFWIGAKFGRAVADRLVGRDELTRLENMSHRFGDWVIIVSRPVPVLAEASILFAGTSRMSLHRFLLLSALSNLGISAAYAAVGAFSASMNSFLLAFMGAILIPAVAMIIAGKENQE